MLQVKKKLFPFYTKRLISINRVARSNVGFEKAYSLGVLYSYETKEKHQAILKFSNKLRANGKKLRVLCYLEGNNKDYDYHFPSFSYHDIQLLGRIKDDKVKEFVNASFDYLYFVDLVYNPILDYLLAKSNAKCRIGKFDPTRTHLFEIMIKHNSEHANSSMDKLITQMLHYTQLLEGK